MGNKTIECTIKGCIKKVFARRWCSTHYSRWKRKGVHTLTRAPNGSGTIRQQGYRVIYVNHKLIFEHRHIMEQILGRKLMRTEVTHHLDGNRLNNHPSNLEVMSHAEHALRHGATFRNKTHKQCTKCRVTKPRWEFTRIQSKHLKSPGNDPHLTMCRACNRN